MKKLIMAMLLMPMMALATTWYVNGSTGSDSNSGTSESSAKATIQAAIDASSADDTILVAPGTYAPIVTGNKAITIKSVAGATSTIIDGGNSQPCAILGNEAGEWATVLDGFTICKGYTSTRHGAGVYCGTIRHCYIHSCTNTFRIFDSDGGGAYGAFVEDSVFENNCATHGAGLNTGIAYRSVFRNNYTYDDGGALKHSTAYNCLIVNNYADNWGGRGSGAVGYDVTNYNCTVVNNHANSGGIFAGQSVLVNCIVAGNTWDGGAFTYEDSEQHTSMLYCCTDSPCFVDAANGDYRLAAGSPCIDAGDNSYVTGDKDLAGNARIANGTVDIGCYEYGAAAGVNITDGLVAYYPFDGNANDASGNGNNGVVHGATLTTDRFGNADGAMYLGWGNWIQVADSESLHSCTQTITIALWTKVNSRETAWPQNTVNYVTKGAYGHYGDKTRQFALAEVYTVDGDYVAMNDPINGLVDNCIRTDCPSVLSVGVWRQIVMSYNGACARTYINGTLVAASNIVSSVGVSIGDLYIGKDLDGGGTEYCCAALDDLRIYNRELSAAEVKALYDGTAMTPTPVTYTVTFDLNGAGGAAPAGRCIAHGAAVGTLPDDVTRTGYSFDGWFTAASGGTKITASTTVTGNVTYYAHWIVNQYTATFNANGGVGGTAKTQDYGTALSAPTVTREGYTFTGWSPAVPSMVPAADTTYTAQWRINSYTVTFDAQGGAGGGTTWYVNGSTGSDSNSGTSESAPKATIQAAIDASAEGDKIYVLPGIYAPIISSNKAITIESTAGASNTFIDGNNLQRCAYLGDSTNQVATVLTGFTLCNGHVNIPWTGLGGAGVKGGTINECIVTNCMIAGSWGGYGGDGGGCGGSFLHKCQIVDCKALAGGGIAACVAYDCEIQGCYSQDDGGGAHVCVLFNCLVVGNYGYDIGRYSCGYGLFGCEAYNCTIVNNTGRSGGGISGSKLYNCIAYANEPQNITPVGARTDETYLVNCITNDPDFVDAANGDYRLAAGSPCIDAGDNSYVTGDKDLAGNARIANGTVDIGCYEYGAAAVTPAGRSITHGAAIGALPDVAREGYSFDGWYTAASGGTKITASTTVTGNVTYYAHWIVNQYTATFDANGGVGGTAKTQDYGTALSAPTMTREGYTFTGWSPAVPATVPAENCTYMAQWTPNKYTITFDANGGVGGTAKTQDYGTALSAPTVTREGYTFTGWTPSVPSTVPAADTTYMAQWRINSYTVTFDAQGGAGGGTVARNHGAALGELPVPTRDGFSFDGWFTAASGGSAVSSGTVITGAVTFYAHWTEVALYPTPVWYDENGEEVDWTKYYDGDEEAFAAESAATFDGYVLDGDEVCGIIQVKASKANKKTGACKVSATLTLIGEAKKLSYKGTMSKRGIAELTCSGKGALSLCLGTNAMWGEVDGLTVSGARNVFSKKGDPKAATLSKWLGAYTLVLETVDAEGAGSEFAWGYSGLSVSIAAKGKVKVSGVMVDGAKVSVTSQLLVGDKRCCIPVVVPLYSKKGGFAFNLWLHDDGSMEVDGLSAWDAAASKPPFTAWFGEDVLVARTGASLPSSMSFMFAGEPDIDGILYDFLPWEVPFTTGSKWAFPAAGSVKYDKEEDDYVDSKDSSNPAGLKLTYVSKTGTFKGSFKIYAVDSSGKLKKLTANVSGVMVGHQGCGTATIKGVGSWPVFLE